MCSSIGEVGVPAHVLVLVAAAVPSSPLERSVSVSGGAVVFDPRLPSSGAGGCVAIAVTCSLAGCPCAAYM